MQINFKYQKIFYKIIILFVVTCFFESCIKKNNSPNIILIMADDLGYGDLACYGNNTNLTPNLDEMAQNGIRLTRFYAAAPVCSPTRGSSLTGRHPYRYGIQWAGVGHLPKEEITIAEALKTKGYSTGHFGKWHVGQLSKTLKQSYFKSEVDTLKYSPPWENGFDESFSTESMMPTYNPYYMVGGDFGTDQYRYIQNVAVEEGQQKGGFRWRDLYWTGEGTFVDKWLKGDNSKIIMDRALNFIKRKTKENNPFLSLIWFHTPHTPIVAGNEHRKLYPKKNIEEQHWRGSITAMDEQIGRLRKELKKMGILENTLIWFSSDNGPSYTHNYNSSGGLRGKKAELYEGGIRVPSIIEWHNKIKKPRESQTISSTSDFYSSLMWACEIDEFENQPVLDGQNILENIINNKNEEHRYLYFQSPLPVRLKKDETSNEEQCAIIGNKYKLISMDNEKTFQLYDLQKDIKETKNLSEHYPNILEKMKKELTLWQKQIK